MISKGGLVYKKNEKNTLFISITIPYYTMSLNPLLKSDSDSDSDGEFNDEFVITSIKATDILLRNNSDSDDSEIISDTISDTMPDKAVDVYSDSDKE